MMKKILVSMALFAGLIGFAGIQLTETAHAQGASEAVCAALGDANPQSCRDSGESQITSVIEFALNALSIAAGIIAVIMIIISGLKFITSQGDSNKASSGRSSIIYAIVGLIIVAFAQIIVRFVISQSSSVAPTTSAPTSSAPTSGVLE